MKRAHADAGTIFIAVILLIVAAAAIAACASTAPPRRASRSPVTPAAWLLPDQHITPGGAAGQNLAAICPHVSRALEAARPSEQVKRYIYAKYGITSRPPGQYEIDHLVPLELGGSNDPVNLWPERNDTPDAAAIRRWHLSPAFIHNSKDVLEDVLHQLVCSGKVPLATAQQAIVTDWRTAYLYYVR